jgi:hypothetical protein
LSQIRRGQLAAVRTADGTRITFELDLTEIVVASALVGLLVSSMGLLTGEVLLCISAPIICGLSIYFGVSRTIARFSVLIRRAGLGLD